MKAKVAFSKPLLVVMIVILVASTTSAATTVYASHQKSSSESSSSSTGSGSKGLDTSGGSSQGPNSSGGSSGSGNTPKSPGSPGSQTSGPNPPGFPPSTQSQQQPACPNGEKPDSSGKCPPLISNVTPKGHTKDFGQGFGKGAEDGKVGVYDPAAACAGASNTAHCIQGYNDSYVAACTHGKFGCGDGPTTCIQGEKCVLPSPSPPPQPCKGNGTCPPPPPPGPTICKKGEVMISEKCVSLGSCHLIDNGTKFECPEGGGHTTIIERNTIHQVPITTNDINLMIVTTCTADQNNGVLNGNLAALCDSTITMMHNDGLDAQLPQVDLYLKARGLLQ